MATHRPSTPISIGSTPEEAPKAQGLTPQQRTAIGVGVLVLCLLIGGGIVYLFLFGSTPKQRSITVDPAQQSAGMAGGPMVRPQPRRQQFIYKENDSTWIARGTAGAMYATKEGNGWKLEPFHPGRDFLTPDQVSLVSAFVRARRDEAMAKEWEISAEQLTKLKGMELRGSSMVVSDRERGELRQMWEDYIKAADGPGKTDAEKKVIARLDELGKNNLEASRKAFTQRLEQIKQVLTPQQIQKMAGR
jgi:Spy/CpxP family protein refolding chaperone